MSVVYEKLMMEMSSACQDIFRHGILDECLKMIAALKVNHFITLIK